MSACNQEFVIKEIPWCANYGVSNDGRVWFRKNAKPKSIRVGDWWEMRTYLNDDGYPRARLRINGVSKQWFVSRLVLEVFRGPCPEGMCARHVYDNDPRNNALWNLAWGTQKQNCEDRKRHGTNAQGERNGRAKLTLSQVRQAYGMFASGMLIYEVADHFGLDRSQMGKILKGKFYRDVAEKISPPLSGQGWGRGAAIRKSRRVARTASGS